MNKKTILGIAVIALMAIVAVTGCSKKDGASAGGGSRAVKADPESDFEARAIDGGAGVEIIKYLGDKWEVNIPPTIRDIPVTSIGKEAFKDKSLISVTIPDSVTWIGDLAFVNNQLTSVTIPNSVTIIGDLAFANNQLTSVTIPNSITTIGVATFAGNQLTSVTIPNSVTSIGGEAFYGNQLTSVTIPNSVTSIGDIAFYNNQLTSVTIPNSVTRIGQEAFLGNPLTSVTIGNGVIGIGSFSNGENFYLSSSFVGNFEEVYNASGRVAGTYTRLDTNSMTWTKQ